MSKYMTRQRKILLSFLLRHPDEWLSAQEISGALADKSISMSAVYRNLSELETEGKVRRSSKGGAREIYYQYTDVAACRNCLHLSCKKCGRTFHMDSTGAEQLIKAVEKNDKFVIDKADTVLYGLCERCQQ